MKSQLVFNNSTSTEIDIVFNDNNMDIEFNDMFNHKNKISIDISNFNFNPITGEKITIN